MQFLRQLMRQVTFRIILLLFVIQASCNDQTKDQRQAEINIQAWHKVSMAFSTGNVEALDNVLAEDYIDHTPMGDFKGRDSVKVNIMRVRTNFKDVKMKIIKEMADEEYGFFWMQFSGKRLDTTGIPSIPFDMTALQIVKFKDGKAVEHWEYVDRTQLNKMGQRK